MTTRARSGFGRGIAICTAAAMAVLLVHAVRRATWVLPVFAGLNLAMLASTPIDGGHYLVDVLAGGLLALVLIWLSRQRVTRPVAAAHAASVTGFGALRQ